MSSNEKAAGLGGDGGGNQPSTSYPGLAKAPYDRLLELAAAVALIEEDLVTGIVAVFPSSVLIAQNEGCEPALVSTDDLRYIYVALETEARRGGDRYGALGLAKRALIHFGHWSSQGRCGWNDERLFALAMERHGDPSVVRDSARALVRLHQDWADAAEIWGPLYVPPPALGQLNPIRIGLALSKFARLSGIPVEHVHHAFALTCARHDGRAAIRDGRGVQ